MILNALRLCNFRQFDGETPPLNVSHGGGNIDILVVAVLVILLVLVAVLGFHGLTTLEILYRKAVRRMILSLIRFSQPLQRCLLCGRRVKIGKVCPKCGSG